MNGRCRLQEESRRGTVTLGQATQGPRWEGGAGLRQGAEPQRVAPAQPPRKGGLYLLALISIFINFVYLIYLGLRIFFKVSY